MIFFVLNAGRRRDVESSRVVRDLRRIVRAGEPGCADIKNNGPQVCQFYIPSCPDCNIDKTRGKEKI